MTTATVTHARQHDFLIGKRVEIEGHFGRICDTTEGKDTGVSYVAFRAETVEGIYLEGKWYRLSNVKIIER